MPDCLFERLFFLFTPAHLCYMFLIGVCCALVVSSMLTLHMVCFLTCAFQPSYPSRSVFHASRKLASCDPPSVRRRTLPVRFSYDDRLTSGKKTKDVVTAMKPATTKKDPPAANIAMVPRRRGRPPKHSTVNNQHNALAGVAESVAKRRGRGRPPKNSVAPSTVEKKRIGRPPKNSVSPRTFEKKRIGRPPKSSVAPTTVEKKRRGRPPKNSVAPSTLEKKRLGRPHKNSVVSSTVKKKRIGRPPKKSAAPSTVEKKRIGRPSMKQKQVERALSIVTAMRASQPDVKRKPGRPTKQMNLVAPIDLVSKPNDVPAKRIRGRRELDDAEEKKSIDQSTPPGTAVKERVLSLPTNSLTRKSSTRLKVRRQLLEDRALGRKKRKPIALGGRRSKKRWTVGSRLTSEPYQPNSTPERPVRKFIRGLRIEAVDYTNFWFRAEIVAVNEVTREVLVHFLGWPSTFDALFPFDSGRIRAAGKLDVLAKRAKANRPAPKTPVKRLPKSERPPSPAWNLPGMAPTGMELERSGRARKRPEMFSPTSSPTPPEVDKTPEPPQTMLEQASEIHAVKQKLARPTRPVSVVNPTPVRRKSPDASKRPQPVLSVGVQEGTPHVSVPKKRNLPVHKPLKLRIRSQWISSVAAGEPTLAKSLIVSRVPEGSRRKSSEADSRTVASSTFGSIAGNGFLLDHSFAPKHAEVIQVKEITTPVFRKIESAGPDNSSLETVVRVEVLNDDIFLKRHSPLEAQEKERITGIEEHPVVPDNKSNTLSPSMEASKGDVRSPSKLSKFIFPSHIRTSANGEGRWDHILPFEPRTE